MLASPAADDGLGASEAGNPGENTRAPILKEQEVHFSPCHVALAVSFPRRAPLGRLFLETNIPARYAPISASH